MRCRGALLALPGLLLIAGCARAPADVPSAAALPTSDLILTYHGETRPRDVRTLVVVLHADQDSARIADQEAFAERIATAVPDSASVSILRPGYSDAAGRASPGERGQGNGDTYTPEHLADIAQAVAVARSRYPKARTLLVGENGGAAIAANLAGIRPDLVDGMVLVSCPCSLPEWRAYMRKTDRTGTWDAPVRSLDPLQTAGGVRPGLKAAILVGADDRRTPPRFSRDYAEALALRGIATDFRVLPKKGDDILLDPQVIEATTRMAASLPIEQRAERR